MIPYSRPKLSDLYTLSQSKQLENHTFHSGTYLYNPYMAVPPPPPPHGTWRRMKTVYRFIFRAKTLLDNYSRTGFQALVDELRINKEIRQ